MGRALCVRPGRHHGEDQHLDRFRLAPVSPGHCRQQGPCGDARQTGHHRGGRCPQDRSRSRHDPVRDRLRQVQVQAGARRHPYECREPAVRADRARGRPAAHRALAQRPGRDRFPAVDPVAHRRHQRAARRLPAGAGREGAEACRHGDAGLHASAKRAAGDLRPSSAGLCRDGGARPRPLCRRAVAAERHAARRRGAGRHLVPDRPRHDRGGARVRPADGEFARRSVRPRLRDGDACRRRRSRRCICRASPRRS